MDVSPNSNGSYKPLLDSSGGTSETIGIVADDPPLKDSPKAYGGLQDIVQFTTQVFFADEDDGKIRVTVMRMGAAAETAKVRFFTEDGSAKAGDQYEAAEGTLTFEPGQHDGHFDVIIEDDDVWHATNEFKVRLDKPRGCELGNYLHTARVKIIDNNHFPSDKYKDEIIAGKEELEALSGAGLFWEYFKLNFQHTGMWWRTSLTVIFDQLHNLNVLLQTWMSMYMVDVVFSKEKDASQRMKFFPGDQVSEVYLMAFLYILPIALMHLWDVARVKMDVQGHTQAYLMTNIVRRYMNLSEDSRILLNASRLQVAILDDSKMIAAGYCSVLDMVKSLGTVSVLTIYTLHSNRSAWWLVVSMPLLMGLFLAFRDYFSETGDETKQKNALLNLVNEMLKNYKLIASYVQRPRINEMVSAKVKALKERKIPLELSAKHDEYFPLWMGALLSAIYMVMHGPEVVSQSGGHHTSLGNFLATISVIRDIAGAFSLLYSGYLKLAETFDPVKEITWVFSLKTDLKTWQHVTKERNETTERNRAEMRKQDKLERQDKSRKQSAIFPVDRTGSILSKTEIFPLDRLKIELNNTTFYFNPKQPVLWKVNLSVSQGAIVAISGGTNSGKSTILQIIAHSLFPLSGSVFVPGHLRMLQVDVETLIFESWSPLENLTFGLPAGQDVDVEKVRAVLEEFKMTQTWRIIQEDLESDSASEASVGPATPKHEENGHDEDPEKGHHHVHKHHPHHKRIIPTPWYERLSSTEKSKLCLARALIANPELLVLHKPFRNFREDEKKIIMEAVLKHIDNRGIGLPEELAKTRRPRTCFYSAVHESDTYLADLVWHMDPGGRTINEEKTTVLGGTARERLACLKHRPVTKKRTSALGSVKMPAMLSEAEVQTEPSGRLSFDATSDPEAAGEAPDEEALFLFGPSKSPSKRPPEAQVVTESPSSVEASRAYYLTTEPTQASTEPTGNSSPTDMPEASGGLPLRSPGRILKQGW